ncbi:hypothetical protein F5X96DRAFT_445583 [Biscogniauxia mediterranea]|nr:hypothetical protein F5X96DRAFT_445583 [Biscogniauxia mediterranea]
MDPASLDPRLRDCADDSIVVNGGGASDSTLSQNNDNNNNNNHSNSNIQDEGSESPPSQHQPPLPPPPPSSSSSYPHHHHHQQHQPQLQHSAVSPTASTSTFTPQTPSGPALSVTGDTPNTLGTTPHDPNDPKRPRACEACRGLKVKCEPDPANPDGPCKRCAKAGRSCVVTQPTRKRQKKTDSRVAELEKKIDALTASLQASRGNGSGSGSGSATSAATTTVTTGTPTNIYHASPITTEQNTFTHSPHASATAAAAARDWGAPPPPPRDSMAQLPTDPGRSSFATPPTMAGQKRKFNDTRDPPSDSARDPVAPPSSAPAHEDSDIIARGIITIDEAADLFQRYTDRMAPHLPAVVFPRGTTVSEVRKTKPILFLAVMAVASSETPHIQRQLVRDLMQILADKLIITGEKSLEIVQALQISVIWYFPPEHFEELKFYQFVHLAAVMAIDIGLGRKKNNPKTRFIPYTWRDHPFRKHPLPDPTSIESRRTWLASYFLASNVAMALHRPNLIRWQPFMTECMDILESSPDAAPTDKYLCHLVWTHRLAEEVGIQFSMDDSSVFVNITEQKIQYALRGFERDLAKYSESIPKEDKQPSLLLSFHVLNLYMHEIALYVDKTSEEYRPPMNADALRDPIPGLSDSLTAAHIGALSACLTAIDGIFETFLNMDTADIRCLPIFNFVRVAYAVVVLIKMYFSASSPNSELGKVINKDNMKVAEYLDKLLDKFRETAASDKSRPASKFVVVLMMLRGWFHKQGQGKDSAAEDQIDPALRGSQPSQSSNAINPSKSRENNASPSQQQQQQPQQQSKFNSPLRLLSEIATGNGHPRNDLSQNAMPPSTNANSPAFQAWLQASASTPQPYIYDPDTSVHIGVPAPGQAIIPWMAGSFTGDLDYSNMGDGFEQAMGLTLTGFGGGSPGDSASYENSMRFMLQNDPLMYGMFDGLPSGQGNQFGF